MKEQRTDNERKEELEKTIMIVNKILENIASFYDDLGIDGLLEIVNPSLDDLLKIIANFEIKANDFMDSLKISASEDFFEYKEIINLKQGLLFARGLIISAIEKNPVLCEEYRSKM